MALLRNPDERRTESRLPANARGVIVAPSLEMACLIVDLSDGGMRVRTDRSVSLPSVVTIVDIAAGTACEADVAWRKGHEAGLKCRVRATALRGLVPARFAQAREAWLRAGGR
ncbi:MAG TPA: PilZ domain-containing protein [Brevundimonas sp.]|jgi:hypothetical protein